MKLRFTPLVCAFVWLASMARAQSFTWSGGGITGDATLGTNWVGGIAPSGTGAETFVFRYPATITTAILPVGTIKVSNLTFQDILRPAYTFSGAGGGALLEFRGNLSVIDSTSAVFFSSSLAIVLNSTLSPTHTVDILSGGFVGVSSVVSESGGANSIFKTGAGQLSLSGSNTFSGGITISGGTVDAGNNTATGSGPISLTSSGATLLASASTVTIGSLSGVAGTTVGINYDGTGTLRINQTTDATFAGVISGFGTVEKLGSGTLTLSGTNTYGNYGTYLGGTDIGTIITAGTLAISSDSNLGSGPLSATPTAAYLTFNGGTLQTTATFTLDANRGIALGVSSGTLNVDPSTTLTYDGIIAGSGALVKAGTGSLALSNANTYSGGTTLNGGLIRLTNTTGSGLGSGTVTINSGTLYIGNFGSSGSLSGNINLANLDTSAVADFAHNAPVGYSGIISGSGGVTIEGGSTLTLSGANIYTGVTNIFAGTTLSDSVTGTYSSGSPINFNGAGAALSVNFNQSVAGLMGSFGTATIASGATLTVGGSSSYSYSSVIAGSGALLKTGSGSQTLTGLNTYTGVTTISAGQLFVSSLADGGSVSGIGASSNAAANLVLNSGGVSLRYTGAGVSTDRLFTLGTGGGGIGGPVSGSAGPVTFTNTGAIVLSGANTARTLFLGSNVTATLNPILGDNGTGASSVNNSGTWTLAGLNTYTGSTTIAAGSITVSLLANGGVASGIGASSNAAANLIIGGGGPGTLAYTGSGASTDRLFTVGAFGGTLDSSGVGALVFSNTGSIALAGSNTARTLNLMGTNTGGNTLAAVLANNGTGATTLVKSGTGTWILTGANTYTGGTTISGGTLLIGGTAGSITGNVANSGVLSFSRSNASSFSGIISGAGIVQKLSAGTLTLTGASTYTGSTTIAGGILSVSSLANGGAASNIGASTNAASNLTIDGGVLQFTGTAMSTDRLFTLGTSGGTLDASGSGAVTFSNTGSTSLSGTNTARTFTLSGTNTGNNTFTSVIGNNGTGATSVAKTGVGIWILSGTNTYSGGTTLGGGTLIANSAGALGTGAITFNGGKLQFGSNFTITNAISFGASGGTISGNGTYATPIIVGTNIVLSPGNSPGTLTFTAGLTLASGGSINFELQDAAGTPGTGYDLVSVSGALVGPGTSIDVTATSGSPFTIHVITLNGSNPGSASNFIPSGAYSWTFATAASGISGFAANKFTLDLNGFANSFAGGGFSVASTGSALTLNFTPVPEPSTWVMMAAGCAAMAGAGLRRKVDGVAPQRRR